VTASLARFEACVARKPVQGNWTGPAKRRRKLLQLLQKNGGPPAWPGWTGIVHIGAPGCKRGPTS
jgi:hypothetical protein